MWLAKLSLGLKPYRTSGNTVAAVIGVDVGEFWPSFQVLALSVEMRLTQSLDRLRIIFYLFQLQTIIK